MHQCAFCLREYKIKVYFDRHVAACELLRKNTSERNDDVEKNADLPDARKMYEMILVLVQKNKTLEKKVEALSKYVAVKKKQLHIKEWLDQNYGITQSFDSFMHTKKLTGDDYKIVCKYDYIEGITMILKNIFPIDSESTLPIRSFDQKDNTFFVKNVDGWNTMSLTELEGLIASIGKQLMTMFVSWQEANKHRLNQDSYTEEYMNILQKMLGGNYSNEVILSKVKRNLYKHLKTNLKSVVQFEFMS